MNDDELWAAGFLSIFGSFFLRQQRGKVVALSIKSKLRTEAVQRFAVIAGTTVIMTSQGMKIQLSGEPLHNLMKRLWAGLPKQRKREYADLRRQVNANA